VSKRKPATLNGVNIKQPLLPYASIATFSHPVITGFFWSQSK